MVNGLLPLIVPMNIISKPSVKRVQLMFQNSIGVLLVSTIVTSMLTAFHLMNFTCVCKYFYYGGNGIGENGCVSNLDQNSLSITNANTDKATGLLDRILLQPTVVQNNKYEKYFLLFLVVP